MELASCSAQNSPKQAGWRWGAKIMGPEGTFHPGPPQHQMSLRVTKVVHTVNETLRGQTGDQEGPQT